MKQILKIISITIAISLFGLASFAQRGKLETPYEESEGLETATYEEVIAFYKRLAKSSTTIRMTTEGLTDSGYPLHLITYSKNGSFDLEAARKNDRRILFINNGIHPGEPCGVDASMMIFRDLAYESKVREMTGDVIIASIPLYNIGGALNRGPHSRTNQIGPKEHGFRGNARNFDLNRDFVKQDTWNARSFAEIFQKVQPDVFLDTHTSNGADYQHVMTLVEGQADKLGGNLGEYYRNQFLPLVYSDMKEAGFPMVPYVQTVDRTPDNGIQGFYDSPRYSSGYAALFQTMGMISEAHMLKTYKERVEGTYTLIKALLSTINNQKDQIGKERAAMMTTLSQQQNFPLHWTVDMEQYSEVEFMGYEAGYKPSEISGKDRLFYDRDKPWTKTIKNYNYYKPVSMAAKPQAYIIPQAWHNIIENLRRNGVDLLLIDTDTTIQVEAYRIANFETRQRVYEGHYLHYNIELEKESMNMNFRKGDFIVSTNQSRVRYIVETLEPQAYDSFFTWNYFETILQMKEYFSSYVFEDLAAEYLMSHSEVKDALKKRKAEDQQFAENARAQLFFIYQQMPNYEPEHLRYPVYRYLGTIRQ
jgi:hypothetical protein